MGVSQETFADLTGLHRTYIGAIERGEKTVTIETAENLAEALQLTLSGLFEGLDARLYRLLASCVAASHSSSAPYKWRPSQELGRSC